MAAVLIAEGNAADGTVIYTDYQSQGKGQRGNIWESEKTRNLLFSVILNVKFLEPADNFQLTQITSLAIHDFLSEYLRHGMKIKWPNDIVYADKKIAGILIENFIKQNRLEWTILGIGVNINQKQFRTTGATSLSHVCGQEFDNEELLHLLLQHLEKRYFQLKSLKLQKIRKDYFDRLYWKDEIHVFQSEEGYFNGSIEGVSKTGKLHVKLESGDRFFDMKEIKFIR
jgi:BirA family biotin operon repressor/biotin-[acetyl-CoA-carboxylase] ligase